MSVVTIDNVMKDCTVFRKNKQKRLDFIKKKLNYNSIIPRPVGSLVHADNHCPKAYMMISLFNNFFVTPKLNSFYGSYQLSYIENKKRQKNLLNSSEIHSNIAVIATNPSVHYGLDSIKYKIEKYVKENAGYNYRVFENGYRDISCNPFEYVETFGEYIQEEYI